MPLALDAAPSGASPDTARHAQVPGAYGRLPLHFELNQGQAAPEVRYLARAPGYTLFVTDNEVVTVLRRGGSASVDRRPVSNQQGTQAAAVGADAGLPALGPTGRPRTSANRRPHAGDTAEPPPATVLRMSFDGAAEHPALAWNDTFVRFTVPVLAAGSHVLTLTTAYGQATTTLTILRSVPVISALRPSNRGPGSRIVIELAADSAVAFFLQVNLGLSASVVAKLASWGQVVHLSSVIVKMVEQLVLPAYAVSTLTLE